MEAHLGKVTKPSTRFLELAIGVSAVIIWIGPMVGASIHAYHTGPTDPTQYLARAALYDEKLASTEKAPSFYADLPAEAMALRRNRLEAARPMVRGFDGLVAEPAKLARSCQQQIADGRWKLGDTVASIDCLKFRLYGNPEKETATSAAAAVALSKVDTLDNRLRELLNTYSAEPTQPSLAAQAALLDAYHTDLFIILAPNAEADHPDRPARSLLPAHDALPLRVTINALPLPKPAEATPP